MVYRGRQFLIRKGKQFERAQKLYQLQLPIQRQKFPHCRNGSRSHQQRLKQMRNKFNIFSQLGIAISVSAMKIIPSCLFKTLH